MTEFRDPQNQHLKQINSASRPLYTPAVLRSTGAESPLLDSQQRPKLRARPSSTSVSSNSSIQFYWNKLREGMGFHNEPEEYSGPSRAHWKPDSSRFSCSNCGRLFNYLTDTRRKHHCRSCGDLFCGECLLNYIYLDNDAKFTVFGPDWGDSDENDETKDGKHLCKVCRSCYLKYEEYVLDHTTRDHNLEANTDNKIREGRRNTIVDNLNDMPVDWDWSSF